MDISEAPPKTVIDWSQFAKEFGVDSIGLYDLEKLKSGSKIEEKQYLTLHVLWNLKTTDVFDPLDWGINRTQAKQHLTRNKHWNDYLQKVPHGLIGNPELGTFDMLWAYQRVVGGLDAIGPETEKISLPISSRTRGALKSKVPNPEETPSKKGGIQNPGPSSIPSTPTRTTSKQPDPHQDVISGIAGINLDDFSDEPETPDILPITTPFSAVLRGDDGEFAHFLPIDDEQIVNTALILLLQGICLRAPSVEKVEWTLQRKSFDFKKTKIVDKKEKAVKLFQARTDGHLRININGASRSLAILEVKASERLEARPYMQESAQMAAWIYAEPDVRNDCDDYQYRYV
jgi:hypothetical protein